ncbi:MAG TPA: long-chain fatty acid--CoA ligase [Burkholderiales bacterium]|jgi:fatty-acyl-CoA synthase|nr:long-chain fatty acid--CoA ligase [Burkholderiales bacterium]
MIRSTMQRVPLSINPLVERAGKLFAEVEIVSRLPDKSLRRHRFADFHRRTRRLGAALLAAGLKKGDRVATLCWNHHAHLECYFGIPAAGGVMHTLNLRLAPDEIGWIAQHAEDRFLIVDDILLPLYEQFKDKASFEKVIVFPFSGSSVSSSFINYEYFIEKEPKEFSYVPHEEDDPIAMCYTSGTTGRPKGVVYSHRSTVIHTLMANQPDHWGLGAGDSVCPVTPMFHANCWGIPYGCVMMGIKMVFPGPHLHPEDLVALFQAEKPNFVLGVPTIWLAMLQLIESDPKKYALPPRMKMLVGGAAVPEALIRAYAKHGAEIRQGWGMTETSPVASIAYLKPELQGASDEERYRRSASAGVPVPVMEIRVRGDDGKDKPWDGASVGELQLRGPFITGSYHNVAEAADRFTADGWLRTGDVAAIDAHGYIRITDRTKDLIKSGGEWISSVDMENLLMAHPSIVEAAVIAIPDPKWSERPLACVVFKQGKSATPEELRAHLSKSFAKWQLPERFEVLDAIPRTSTGKFWKVKLRERYGAPAVKA